MITFKQMTPWMLGLEALLVAATGTFLITLSHVDVDRVQESWYLGVPYGLIQDGHVYVSNSDPFPENGPQSVYPPAAIVYLTGSLLPMRIYQFIFSLIVIGLLFYFFFRKFQYALYRWREVAVYSIVYLAVWISIPLALIYPIQVNGMTAGFACLLLGLMIYPQYSMWGMFCFGWAFAFKGQYLALLPGFVVYLFFIDVREATLGRHLLKSCAAFIMFFVPKTLILAGLWEAMGMFQTRKDFWLYALDGPHLLASQFQFILGHLSGQAGAAAPEAGPRRAVEYSGFGLIAWGHIVASALFCVLFSLRSIWKRTRTPFGEELDIDKGLAIFAWGGLSYWVNYLLFYRYPYWYNVFAVVFLNIFLAAACVRLAGSWLSVKFGKQWSSAFLLVTVIISLSFIIRYMDHEWTKPKGNALTPYEWMRNGYQ